MRAATILVSLVLSASSPSQAQTPDTEDATLVSTTFGAIAGQWSVKQHPRVMADVNNDGQDDIVGFGGEGVWVAISTSTADVPSFAKHAMALDTFGYSTSWRVEKHPRLMADVNNDGRADIVGFGNAGVYVSLSTSTDAEVSFSEAFLAVDTFGHNAGGWRVEEHLRFLADVNNDGRDDIVAFGNHSVYVSLSTSTATTASFAAHEAVLREHFTPKRGFWSIRNDPRMVADVNDDGRADIVGFGTKGVYVSLSTSTADAASFTAPVMVMPGFGSNVGKWRYQQHLRLVEDVNGDGRGDIVAIGDEGVFVALSMSSTDEPVFQAPVHVVPEFGRLAGGWAVGKNPRFIEDVNGDGRKDIVGFGNKGVVISLSSSTELVPAFQEPQMILRNMAHDAGGWRIGQHPRTVADVNGDGAGDLVGFGNEGAFVFLTGKRWDKQGAVIAAVTAEETMLTNGKDIPPRLDPGIYDTAGNRVFYVEDSGQTREWTTSDGGPAVYKEQRLIDSAGRFYTYDSKSQRILRDGEVIMNYRYNQRQWEWVEGVAPKTSAFLADRYDRDSVRRIYKREGDVFRTTEQGEFPILRYEDGDYVNEFGEPVYDLHGSFPGWCSIILLHQYYEEFYKSEAADMMMTKRAAATDLFLRQNTRVVEMLNWGEGFKSRRKRNIVYFTAINGQSVILSEEQVRRTQNQWLVLNNKRWHSAYGELPEPAFAVSERKARKRGIEEDGTKRLILEIKIKPEFQADFQSAIYD